MPFSSIRPSISGPTTQEALSLTVATTGSDTSPGTITTQAMATAHGAFATLNGALAALPKELSHAVTISVGAGTYATSTVSGFHGSGSLTFTGVMASPGLTGSMTGTATAATTTTITPTTPGWVASELLGSFVEITDVGVGTLDYRPITINTTGVVTFLAISTCNNNDTFRILVPTTILTSLTVTQNSCPVTFNYCRIGGKTDTSNTSATYNVCKFQAATTTSSNNLLTTFTNCIWAASSVPSFTDTAKLVFTNCCLHVSNMTVTGARRITGDMVALACTTSSALTLNQVDMVALGFDAKNCTFSPLTLTDVTKYVVSGIGLTGTSNTGAVGVAASGDTCLEFSSTPTLVGTANASANGTTHTWANASTSATTMYGSVKYISTPGVTWGTGGGNVTILGTITVNTSLNVSTNATVSGTFSTAYAAVSAAGSAIGDAAAASSGPTVLVTTVGAGQGILLPVPTTTPAKTQDYINLGANTLNIYPSSGSTQIHLVGTGLQALGAPVTLAVNKLMRIYPASATLYYAVLLN